MTQSSRPPDSRSWTRLGACIVLACGPLAVALLTEDRWAGEDSRVAFLLALGLALAAGAALLLRADDTRGARRATAQERALRQARDQQAATAEILGAIAASPPDLQRVLDTIARNAARVCDGLYAVVFRFDGTLIRMAAHHDLSHARLDAINQRYPKGLEDEGLVARAIRNASVVHCPDVRNDPGVATWLRELALAEGFRSMVIVPMLREGRAIGTLNVSRPEGGFTELQIQLLRTFADQAVIAIENVRLFTELGARNRELTESLEQQTATGAILRVISGSPTDIQPVLDAVAESATRLCDARDVSIALVEQDVLKVVASHGLLARWWPDEGIPISRGSVTGRAVVDRGTVHVHDLASESDQEFPQGKVYQRLGGHRTNLAVPLLREGVAIGVIAMRREEVRPFTDRQVRLLETFADQAVIAIENVRLFQALQTRNRELTEALEQQTATAEILGVISRSPTDLQPVLEAVARNASRLCGAANVSLYRVEGDLMRKVAEQGPPLTALRVGEIRPITRTRVSGRAIVDRTTIHVPDHQSAESAREYPDARRDTGIRTTIGIPLLREGVAIGAFSAYRTESRAFSEREIALLQTFADQAVIAIENVRLFQELQARNRELSEALEQQTATGEILRVISSSPTDLAPVMDAVVRNATRLARADHALIGEAADGRIRWLAASGCPLVSGGVPISRELPSGRAILDCQTTQVEDVTGLTVAFLNVRQAHDELGVRTILATPLVREGLAVGVLLVRRTRVHPFTDKEIELLRTFADQAVIAIENVRLFQELRARNYELTEALEQQTATAEILRVIGRSPTDTQPVFDTIVQRANRLCGGLFSGVFRYDGELMHFVAHANFNPEALEVAQRAFPRPPTADVAAGRAILERAVVHISDVTQAPAQIFQRSLGYRSVLAVPMLGDGRPIGVIAVTREEPGPFANAHITLLQTFADQAVIAIENVRLFQELEAQTRALARSVEELQALSEVGRAVSSTLDLPTVLATIVARAVQLSGTSGGVIYEYDEAAEEFHVRASHRTEEELVEVLRATPIRLGEGVSGEAALQQAPVEVGDVLDPQQYQVERIRSVFIKLGYRSSLGIPLLVERRILGALTVWRREPGSFPTGTVKLLQTFATQSALAIQNARLFREIEAKSRELEVASRHKSQFLANMSHELRTPLNAILGYTELLVDGIYGDLSPKAGDVMTRIDRSGKHLLGLINDVLDLSKIEAGQLELALADYSLTEVVHAVVTQVEALAAEKGLILQVTVTPDLPAGRGDERRLAQVLLNLVGNAIKFTEVGSVRVAAYRDGDAFVVSVADTGPGIAEADRQRIFEEFQQADSSSTRRKGGTGLGLSIAKRIVELHGGQLWVDSAVGRGSTFSFRVPVRVERQVARA